MKTYLILDLCNLKSMFNCCLAYPYLCAFVIQYDSEFVKGLNLVVNHNVKAFCNIIPPLLIPPNDTFRGGSM